MDLAAWLDHQSLTKLFFGTLALSFGCIALGTLLRKGLGGNIKENDATGSVVGATLGLLAFLLAFTFNMAANRFDERKELLLADLNAIETTYLRAGFLSEAYRNEVRRQLTRYVGLRVEAVRQPGKLAELINQSEKIHQDLWTLIEYYAIEQPLTIADSLYIQSLNEMIDLHSKRVVVALRYRIPDTIWLGLYAIAVLAMLAVGFQFGQASTRQHLVNIMLGAAFSAVIILIADLDRAVEGTVMVDQGPLFNLYDKLSQQLLPPNRTDATLPLAPANGESHPATVEP